jgi:hypothetical protein
MARVKITKKHCFYIPGKITARISPVTRLKRRPPGRMHRSAFPRLLYGMLFLRALTRHAEENTGLDGGRKPMDQQEFKLTVEEKAGYLHVHASGVRSQTTVKAMTGEVFNTALEKHLSKVLIDVRELTGTFGIKDIYFLVADVLKDLHGKGVDQVAVIDIRRSAREGWFLETVAQNRGFNFRVFAADEPALKWLGAG